MGALGQPSIKLILYRIGIVTGNRIGIKKVRAEVEATCMNQLVYLESTWTAFLLWG